MGVPKKKTKKTEEEDEDDGIPDGDPVLG